jgi:5-methylcytosine-specific restriction endonuclease McrA
MSTPKAPRLCTRCGTPKIGRRCPRCPLPAGERRPYSDTAEYRRVLAEVLERDGAVCGYCVQPIAGVEVTPSGRGGALRAVVDRTVADPLVLGHRQAHADGGAFSTANTFPAHRSCNARAGRRPVEDLPVG